MICECGQPVFDPEDLIDGLCDRCVSLLFSRTEIELDLDPRGRYKNEVKKTRKSASSTFGRVNTKAAA